MGLWSLPHPTEGMLCILMVNISIFKDFVRSIIPLSSSSSSSSSSSPPSLTSSENPSSELFDFPHCHSDSFLEEFRDRTPTLRFSSICNCNKESDYDYDHDHECSVCLTKFEPESEINRLGCGHSFHKLCLEKWIDYWNMTCPLCRASLVI